MFFHIVHILFLLSPSFLSIYIPNPSHLSPFLPVKVLKLLALEKVCEGRLSLGLCLDHLHRGVEVDDEVTADKKMVKQVHTSIGA